jgi:hypothetical protein
MIKAKIIFMNKIHYTREVWYNKRSRAYIQGTF